MTVSLHNITVDCADARALGAFWSALTGWPLFYDDDPEVLVAPSYPPTSVPTMLFIPVPEGKTAKNRMHIDIRVAGEPPWDMAEREQLIRTKVSDLAAWGATLVREESYGDQLGHVVLLDPEGNEFCVA